MSIFYFRSYNRIIGHASNVKELQTEISRLAWEDPETVAYHLFQGHISVWLKSIGEVDLAHDLQSAKTIYDAQIKIAKYNERSEILHRMQLGRMR